MDWMRLASDLPIRLALLVVLLVVLEEGDIGGVESGVVVEGGGGRGERGEGVVSCSDGLID